MYDTVLIVLGDNEEADKTEVSETATAQPSSGLLIMCVCVCACMHVLVCMCMCVWGDASGSVCTDVYNVCMV